MAKEFKDFDKLYKHLEGIIPEEEGITEVDRMHSYDIKSWAFKNTFRHWSNEEIRYAVYESDTADTWQRFRISLKGNATRLKLLRLAKRYVILARDNPDQAEARLERIRIDNYISALRRGGQLNIRHEVVR